MRVNHLWVKALHSTRYSDKSGSENIYDGTLCIAGGIDEAKPFRFLMGQIPGSAGQAPPELRWMIDTADCLKRIAFATQEDEITKEFARLNEVLRKQESMTTSPDARK